LSVTFVRTALGPNTVTGLEFVQIAEITDSGGIALLRRTAPFAPFTGNGAQLNFANPVVMVRAPYRVTFSYAGPDRVWRDTWRGAAQLPSAIRIRVRDAATFITLAESTATVVHAEVPARCAQARTASECAIVSAAAQAASSSGPLGQ
jgi:general secretion pathway protein J